MSKTFDKFFDDILEEYAAAVSSGMAGIDRRYYLAQLRRELKNNIMSWFVKHVEEISDNKEKIKDELFL